MESAQTKESKFITLRQASQTLGVNVETLLEWNDDNILKPIISQDGVIGYKQEQLDKFISVQKLIQTNDKQTPTPDFKNIESNTSTNVIIETPPRVKPSRTAVKIAKTKNSSYENLKLFSYGLLSCFLVVSVSLIISYKNASTSSTSENKIASVYTASVDKTNSPEDSNITAPENKLDSPITIQAKASTIAAETRDESSTDLTYNLGGNTQDFTSRPNILNNSGTDKQVLDENGNLIGKTSSSDSLIASIGTSSLFQTDRPLGRKLNTGIIVSSLLLGLLWAVYAFKHQPAYSTVNQDTTSAVLNNQISYPTIQKALEVDQKTDGTVVVYFEDKEYKISKPELNSETDRLIQRLLGKIGQEKEIEYDILEDESLELSSPLSKIVTRLGFIGVKRDLFFPRTSKNKVVFRKYITKQELSSMSLSDSHISKELLN